MEGLKPGRIVYYVLDGADVGQIMRTRQARYETAVVVGSEVQAGDVCPAMVTRVWDTTVNLKVMLDGEDTLWATSVIHNPDRGLRSWHWMFDGQATRYQPDRQQAPAAETKVGGSI